MKVSAANWRSGARVGGTSGTFTNIARLIMETSAAGGHTLYTLAPTQTSVDNAGKKETAVMKTFRLSTCCLPFQ